MELQIKHLTPYLGHDLKFLDLYNKEITTLTSINKKIMSLGDCKQVVELNGYMYDLEDLHEQYLPIFRPILDFNKTIEHDGYVLELLYELENDKNIEWFDEDQAWSYLLKYEHKIESTDFIPYGIMEKLFEYHFDVFGLIEKGLAVDINTIN